MVVTLSGMVMLVIDLQSEKAQSPMLVTVKPSRVEGISNEFALPLYLTMVHV